MSELVQTLWIGNKLSPIEQMCLQSFVRVNGGMVLYAYSDIEGVPEGVEIRDANTILDESEIFSYAVGEGKGSVSAFSNCFRYKLLLDKGGWWVDTDVLCLNPLPKGDDYVFSTEYLPDWSPHVATGIIKSEAGSKIMQECFDFSMDQDREKLMWGQIGPKLLHRKVEELGMQEHTAQPVEYNPLHGAQVAKLFDPKIKLEYGPETKTLHLWNEIWRRFGVDKNATYHPDSYIERKKKELL